MKSINTTLLLLSCLAAMPATAQQNSGKASYYANSLHGRKMSNGQPYDRNRLTCAHRTLPFGTKIKVTNPANGKEVIVEVTDRGPYAHGRVIDLSYAAAKEIGMVAAGVASIRLEVLPPGVTLPYASDGNVFDTTIFDTPTIEYGTAGVCYEFIPEWKNEDADKAVANNDSHNKNNQGNNDNQGAQKSQSSKTTPSTQHNKHQHQPHHSQQTKKPATEKQQAKPQQKSGDSKHWTDFFIKLKDIF